MLPQTYPPESRGSNPKLRAWYGKWTNLKRDEQKCHVCKLHDGLWQFKNQHFEIALCRGCAVMLFLDFADLIEFEPDIVHIIGTRRKDGGRNFCMSAGSIELKSWTPTKKRALDWRKRILSRYAEKLRQILADIEENNAIIEGDLDY